MTIIFNVLCARLTILRVLVISWWIVLLSASLLDLERCLGYRFLSNYILKRVISWLRSFLDQILLFTYCIVLYWLQFFFSDYCILFFLTKTIIVNWPSRFGPWKMLRYSLLLTSFINPIIFLNAKKKRRLFPILIFVISMEMALKFLWLVLWFTIYLYILWNKGQGVLT